MRFEISVCIIMIGQLDISTSINQKSMPFLAIAL